MPADTLRSFVAERARRVVQAGAREPLVQFMAIALVLFGANHFIEGSDPEGSGDSITISAGRVQQIADSYRLLSGRLPSRTEMQVLLHDFVDEEIAYREAVALGLDVDDTIVRRRMRQKLEFLLEDAEAIDEPSDAQLATWLHQHAAQYRIPQRVAFRQILASADAHGTRANDSARVMLGKLRTGSDPTQLGDASMLPSAMTPTTEQGVATLFGKSFAEALFAHGSGGWFGPIESPLGAHAVLILARQSARDPLLDEVRGKLRSDWIEANRQTKRAAFQARLRERYEINVEWPEIYAAEPVAAHAPSLAREQTVARFASRP